MKLSIDKIKLDSKLERLFPKMPEEEFEALKRNIKVNGLIKPLVLAQDYTLVDGYHRLKACKSLKMKEVEVDIKELIKNVYENKVSLREALKRLKKRKTTKPKMYPLMIPYELYERYEEKYSEPRKTMIEVLERGVSNVGQ